SRSGIIFSIVSTTAFFLLYGRANGKQTNKVFWLIIAAGIAAAGVWIGFERVLQRFVKISEEITSERGRFQLYKDTARIFLNFPIAGTGAGTFSQIFPMYRSFVTHDFYLYAHSDY